MESLAEGAGPFRLAVINDEITQDFEKACQIVSVDFGLRWIELRSMWNKNVTELDAKQVEDARKILEEHKLRVTDVASPLFKTDWGSWVRLARRRILERELAAMH
jgi:L-ribulose-5-phosphate 3-epimerase